MRILGIDPGSRVLGYAVVTATGERAPHVAYVECGVVENDGAERLEKRLAEIVRGVGEVIEELRPDVVAIEDVFARVNPRAALTLGHARGAALAAAGLAGLAVYAYPAPLVKKAVTGRGRASKDEVAHMVRALLGLRATPRADAADALAVAVAHAHLRRDLDLAMRRAA